MTAYMSPNMWASLGQARQQATFSAQLENHHGYTPSLEYARKEKVSKFEKLSNHKFHELLDKFAEMI